jgi:LmbE family N-acetylglucosaminyl deacetylase
MLPLQLPMPTGRPLSVVVIGAHPDDIEIGAGGLLLGLARFRPQVRYAVLTGTRERHEEARAAASSFLPGADVTVDAFDLPEGRLPANWGAVKEILEGIARSCTPDFVITPSAADAHQDHRTIGELIPTVFRDQLHLAYEIPKWDGDMGRPNMYFPMTEDDGQRKVQLLNKCYASQRARDWWDDEVFLGLARLRGMECRARYAEAFFCSKTVIDLPALDALRLRQRKSVMCIKNSQRPILSSMYPYSRGGETCINYDLLSRAWPSYLLA